MKTGHLRRWRTATIGIALLGSLLPSSAAAQEGSDAEGSSGDETPRPGRTIVRSDTKHDTSPPLRVMARQAPSAPGGFQPARGRGPGDTGIGGETTGVPGQGTDPVVQSGPAGGVMPGPSVSFEGISNADNTAIAGITPIPPDTVGDIGPEHYVQMVNVLMSVFDKSGNEILGPIETNTIWNGFGGDCENFNQGDPIVLYDPLADRWLISQFGFSLSGPNPVGPYFECVAVSQTGDPTGSWHRYAFQMPDASLLNDYPKLGVWPDAYYMGINEFDEDTGFGYTQASLVAFERDQMLAGGAANMLYHTIGGNFFTPMPADLDGFAVPPPGTPGIFVEVEGEEFGYASDRLHVFEMAVDWATNSATVTGPTTLITATANINTCAGSRDCIPQPAPAGITSELDAIDDRLMHRAAYRNIGGTESLVLSHAVNSLTLPSHQEGVRWYELRGISGSPTIFQQGTYAPADGVHRWMSSAAMDQDGNIAVGYSVSNGSGVFPGIRWAGRLAGDTLGTLGQGEAVVINGGGSQTDMASRWGDYSAMSVDPADDCTFWYTQEYYSASSTRGWQTRIAAFKFPGCDDGVGTTISVGDSWNREGSSITFPVTLSNPAGGIVTVDYSTLGGSATSGVDFTFTAGTVTFQAGDTVESITVPTTGDTDQEGNETFTLNLSNANGASIADGSGLGTIIDRLITPKCPGREGEVGNHIVGTSGADVLIGTGTRDIICGLGGNDYIDGKAGNDLLLGGLGTDAILGGLGADYIDLGAGNDSGDGADFGLFGAGGGAGNDILIGGLGADDLFGWAGADTLNGGSGEDVLFGNEGNDTLNGGSHLDILLGNAGNDVLNGGTGFDCGDWENELGPVTASLVTKTASGPGIGSDTLNTMECLLGTPKADKLTGNGGGNTLWGFNGNDVLNGLAGGDYLHGFAGFDTLNCGPGFDLGIVGLGGGTVNGCEDTTLGREGASPLVGSSAYERVVAARSAQADRARLMAPR